MNIIQLKRGFSGKGRSEKGYKKNNILGCFMATMVTDEELEDAVKTGSFIKGGAVKCVEGIKYDFRLSNHILKAKFGRPVDASQLTSTEKSDLVIEPNEVVFVLSEETMELPPNMFAQLSPKRKMSQAGVLTLGGLTIDPGYHGKLLVGLLNFSSTIFTLKPSKKLIAASFFQLDETECPTCHIPTEELTEFPDELIDVMQKYKPVGTNFLAENIDGLRLEIDRIKRHLREQDDWRKVLDRHDEQIDNLLKGLEAEKNARLTGEDRFSNAIVSLNNNFAAIKGGAKVLFALLAILIIPMMIQVLGPIILKMIK